MSHSAGLLHPQLRALGWSHPSPRSSRASPLPCPSPWHTQLSPELLQGKAEAGNEKSPPSQAQPAVLWFSFGKSHGAGRGDGSRLCPFLCRDRASALPQITGKAGQKSQLRAKSSASFWVLPGVSQAAGVPRSYSPGTALKGSESHQ